MPRAKKVKADGYTFDSQVEFARYLELKSMLQAGEITGLKVHPSFEVVPAFKDSAGNKVRACTYTADFEYVDNNGRRIVEDVKGAKWDKRSGCYKPYLRPGQKDKVKMFRWLYRDKLIFRYVL